MISTWANTNQRAKKIDNLRMQKKLFAIQSFFFFVARAEIQLNLFLGIFSNQ